MNIVLIRHFQTPGNLVGNYIGVTDEDLIPINKELNKSIYPKVNKLYVSPLKRCVQTAELIYPGQAIRVKENLKECNFGRFENKNFQDLSVDESYQKWVDCGGKMKFPEGEDPEEFKSRCSEAFLECMNECLEENETSVALVVHGGTIMSIMEAFDTDGKGFYEYQVKNGNGYVLRLNEEQWKNGDRKLLCISTLEKEMRR